MRRRRAARAGGARAEVAAALRAVHGLRAGLPATFSSFRIVETLRGDGAGARRRGSRRLRAGPRAAPARIEAALRGARARAGPLPQRPARRQLHPLAGRAADRRLGVCGDGRPLLRPRQLRRQQRARRRTRRRRCSPPTSASRATAGQLAALRLMRFMSDFREAMWGSCRAPSPTSTSTSTSYAAKHFDRLGAAEADAALRDPARGGRRWPRAELPSSRPLRDHRRRRRRHLARLPPGEARLGRRRPARALAAHLGLDLPLRRPGRPAARLGLADEDDDALGRALPAARRRVRVRPRLGRVRRHPPRLQRGADGGAAPPGRLGEDLRPAAGADLGRRRRRRCSR